MPDQQQHRCCGDCAAETGEEHDSGCDVARCLRTGNQRLSCPAQWSAFHDCGRDIWAGCWPGEADCREHDLWCYWQHPAEDEQHGQWVQCTVDHPQAMPDLNRLHLGCRWDTSQQKWVLGPCDHEFIWHVVVDEEGPDRLRECQRCGMLDSEALLTEVRKALLLKERRLWFFDT